MGDCEEGSPGAPAGVVHRGVAAARRDRAARARSDARRTERSSQFSNVLSDGAQSANMRDVVLMQVRPGQDVQADLRAFRRVRKEKRPQEYIHVRLVATDGMRNIVFDDLLGEGL